VSSKPQKSPLGYISIRVFAHATEDQERVTQALRNTLPPNLANSAVFKKTNLSGHHGNPIVLIETELAERTKLMPALEKIGESLTSLDKEKLYDEMERHLEKGNLYLRLDKQLAYLGELTLSSNDPIHFKFHFRNKTQNEILTICKDAGLLP
jgi:RNA-binding protein